MRRLLFVPVIVALLVETIVLAAPSTASVRADPYPPSQCPTVAVSGNQMTPGESFTVSGSGYRAGTTVRIWLDPTTLKLQFATARTDSKGRFVVHTTFPRVHAGAHVIVGMAPGLKTCSTKTSARVFGVDAADANRSSSAGAAGITTSTGGSGPLSSTGVDIALGVVAALALLVAGSLLLGAGRNRRRVRVVNMLRPRPSR